MSFKDNKPYHINDVEGWYDLDICVTAGENIVAVVSIKEQIQEMQKWCHDNNCGHRMSFDVFRFDTPEQKTMFMLRWAV